MNYIVDIPAKSLRTVPSTIIGFMWIRFLLGIILAIGGQAVLGSISGNDPLEGQTQAIGGGMLILGALLFGAPLVGAAKVSLFPRLEFPRGRVSQPISKWRNHWTLFWLGAAVILFLIAVGLFATTEETSTVILIWLCGIAALVVSQITTIRIPIPSIAREERVYILGLVILLIIALISRTYEITTLPYNLDGDFADVGLQARALATGQEQRVFAYGWAEVPMLGYLPPWLTMTIFGTDLTGLNASGVIQGLLIIVGVYLLGRDLFHKRVGLLAAALLTISYTHLAASRQSSYIDPVFFLVYAIYFLILGMREGRGLSIAISGLLTALCIQMYYSGRLVAFIVAFILLYLLLFRRAWLWARWWTVLLWIAALLITLGPMLVVFVRDFDGFMARTRAVNIFNPDLAIHMQFTYQVDTFPEVLAQQARRSALMFNYYKDTGTQFALLQPFLDPFTGVLFILGVGHALFRWRSFSYATVLAWLVLGVVIGCFLTINPPFWARLIILLPPTALLAAIALHRLYEMVDSRLKHINSYTWVITPLVSALILTVVGIQNWNSYVEAKGTFATPRTRIGRYLADQPASTRAYLVSAEYSYNDREFEFLAPGYMIAHFSPEQAQEEISLLDTPILVILTPEQSALLTRLEEQYQDETVEIIADNAPNEIAFYVLRLP